MKLFSIQKFIIFCVFGLDRNQVEDMEKDVIDRRAKLEHYIKALSAEIKARNALVTVLDQADSFYHNQRGEVKVVANAYRNFGNRIKTMKRKLEELTKTLPSPMPSPDINAPSPGPADAVNFVLPGEKNYNQVNTYLFLKIKFKPELLILLNFQ